MKLNNRLTDEIYTSDTVKLGENAFRVMQETIHNNGGVGTITGDYDAELSILMDSFTNARFSYAQFICTDRTQIGVPSVSAASSL